MANNKNGDDKPKKSKSYKDSIMQAMSQIAKYVAETKEFQDDYIAQTQALATKTESQQTGGTEMVPTEKVGTEIVGTKKVSTETVPTETVRTEKVPTEKVPTEKVGTEIVGTEIVRTEKVGSSVEQQETLSNTENVPPESDSIHLLATEKVRTEKVRTEIVGTYQKSRYPTEKVPTEKVGTEKVRTEIVGILSEPIAKLLLVLRNDGIGYRTLHWLSILLVEAQSFVLSFSATKISQMLGIFTHGLLEDLKELENIGVSVTKSRAGTVVDLTKYAQKYGIQELPPTKKVGSQLVSSSSSNININTTTTTTTNDPTKKVGTEKVGTETAPSETGYISYETAVQIAILLVKLDVDVMNMNKKTLELVIQLFQQNPLDVAKAVLYTKKNAKEFASYLASTIEGNYYTQYLGVAQVKQAQKLVDRLPLLAEFVMHKDPTAWLVENGVDKAKMILGVNISDSLMLVDMVKSEYSTLRKKAIEIVNVFQSFGLVKGFRH